MEKEPTRHNGLPSLLRQRRVVTNHLDNVECKYYQDKLHEHKKEFKRIFDLCNGLLRHNKDLAFPPSNSVQELADQFNQFFTNKTENIRIKLCDINRTALTSGQKPQTERPNINLDCSLEEFAPITEKDVIRFVFLPPSILFEVDLISTELLKDIMELISPLMETIVNKSITSGVFPDSLKEALFCPILKKPNLDLLDQNYKPLSNLTFLSKTTEHTVSSQLASYTDINHFMEVNNSAYKAKNSTETTLIMVKSDILKVIDQQGVVCLLLLHLSAAFDTKDHEILLRRLEECFEITALAFLWINSYLTNRRQ